MAIHTHRANLERPAERNAPGGGPRRAHVPVKAQTQICAEDPDG